MNCLSLLFILVLALNLFSFVFLDLDESSNLGTTKTNLENCKLVGENVIQCCRNKNYWEYVLKALFLSSDIFLQTCIVQCYGILQCIQNKNKIASITRKYMLFFLHLHEIVEGLYFYCSLSVCVSVCVSVSLCVRLCEQNSSRTDAPIWTRFSL